MVQFKLASLSVSPDTGLSDVVDLIVCRFSFWDLLAGEDDRGRINSF